MATRGTITIENSTRNPLGYDTQNYPCHRILDAIYKSEFKDFLLQIEFTVGGTYNFSPSANGQTCYMYYGNGPMKTIGVVTNGHINVATSTFSYVAGDVQRNPQWFNRISFGCGNTSSTFAHTKPNYGSGQFHIVMHFNIPDWFVAGEPVAQTNDTNHQKIHRFIQYFYDSTIYVPFRINANNITRPFKQEITIGDGTRKIATIGKSGATMSATDENTILYSTYANRTFTE